MISIIDFSSDYFPGSDRNFGDRDNDYCMNFHRSSPIFCPTGELYRLSILAQIIIPGSDRNFGHRDSDYCMNFHRSSPVFCPIGE